MFELDYFGRALVEAALAGALAGLVGVVIVLRERAFTAMSLTHATFPGAVAAAIIGAPVVLGAAVAGALLLGVSSLIARVRGQGGSVASAVMLSAGFALGALLAALTHVPIDVEAFLTGNVLASDAAQLWLTVAALAVTILVLLVAGPRLLASTFDTLSASRQGISAWRVEAVSLALIGLAVVVIGPVIGAILAIALLVGPAAAAKSLTRDVRTMALVAPAIGAACGVAGLVASRTFDTAAGATISLVAGLVFLAARGADGLRSTVARRRAERVLAP